jgi:hypothetical protein
VKPLDVNEQSHRHTVSEKGNYADIQSHSRHLNISDHSGNNILTINLYMNICLNYCKCKEICVTAEFEIKKNLFSNILLKLKIALF